MLLVETSGQTAQPRGGCDAGLANSEKGTPFVRRTPREENLSSQQVRIEEWMIYEGLQNGALSDKMSFGAKQITIHGDRLPRAAMTTRWARKSVQGQVEEAPWTLAVWR